MALKAEGNLAFARGDFTAAVALYSRALDTPIATPDLPCEGGRRVAYLLNRAQAYLKRAPTTPDPAAPPDECATPRDAMVCTSRAYLGREAARAGKTSRRHMQQFIRLRGGT